MLGYQKHGKGVVFGLDCFRRAFKGFAVTTMSAVNVCAAQTAADVVLEPHRVRAYASWIEQLPELEVLRAG